MILDNCICSLERELNRAKVVQPAEIPADVITMNSRVHLKDLEAGEDLFYTLVFPSDADFGQNRISILAPIGTALLGYRVGDEHGGVLDRDPSRPGQGRHSQREDRRVQQIHPRVDENGL